MNDYDASAATLALMQCFNAAFVQRRPELLAPLIAEDCVIENTVPAPNGERLVGHDACLALWSGLAASRDGCFEPEDIEAYGERAIVRWRYRWGDDEASSVRGVNLMRVRNGRIVEALGYVKGA
ncbi:MAG: nuclear transport factor 2 family protein [Gammaproteobacteria bacterium]